MRLCDINVSGVGCNRKCHNCADKADHGIPTVVGAEVIPFGTAAALPKLLPDKGAPILPCSLVI